MATTKKTATSPKKSSTKATETKTETSTSNEVEKKLSLFKMHLGVKVEHGWYNLHVLPLQQRFDAGEVSESLTDSVMKLSYPTPLN